MQLLPDFLLNARLNPAPIPLGTKLVQLCKCRTCSRDLLCFATVSPVTSGARRICVPDAIVVVHLTDTLLYGVQLALEQLCNGGHGLGLCSLKLLARCRLVFIVSLCKQWGTRRITASQPVSIHMSPWVWHWSCLPVRRISTCFWKKRVMCRKPASASLAA